MTTDERYNNGYVYYNDNGFMVLFFFAQKLDKTRKLLDKRGVTYSVNLFETDTGITSLEKDLFTVSS